jgi:transcriptional regulator with XRE-family HTH domain
MNTKIREVRLSKNISQGALAEKIGKDRSLISRYEDGSVDIPISMMCKISRALDVPLADLLESEK